MMPHFHTDCAKCGFPVPLVQVGDTMVPSIVIDGMPACLGCLADYARSRSAQLTDRDRAEWAEVRDRA